MTQLPMMMRSFGLSSTFRAMPVLRCRLVCRPSLQRMRPSIGGGGFNDALLPFLTDVAAILSEYG
jgi:hypothetical protein